MKMNRKSRIAATAVVSALGVGGIAWGAPANGTFTGDRQYAYYGYVKVEAVVQNGTISDVKVLEYPNDNGRSVRINSIALPYLIQETVGGSSARVDVISGATFTSLAYEKSLQAALRKAGI